MDLQTKTGRLSGGRLYGPGNITIGAAKAKIHYDERLYGTASQIRVVQ